MYRERESILLGQVSAGVFGLWCLYHFVRWCQYKMQKVKDDKKLMRHMVENNLPAKPKYPIFSATASLCCTLDIEEAQESAPVENTNTPAAPTVPPPVATSITAAVAATVDNTAKSTAINTTAADPGSDTPEHTYRGQGAYIDGPATYVDLEANMHNSRSRTRSRNNNREEKRPEAVVSDQQLTSIAIVNSETEERTVVMLPVPVSVPVLPDPAESEISDLSEASSISDESSDESDSSQSDHDGEESTTGMENAVIFKPSAPSGQHSYPATDFNPSDDDDVIYTISSDSKSDTKSDSKSENGDSSAGRSERKNKSAENEPFDGAVPVVGEVVVVSKRVTVDSDNQSEDADVSLSDESVYSKFGRNV